MIDSHDRGIIRELAQRVADIAGLPTMAERRELWKRHNRLDPGRPMILVFPEGSWLELIPEATLRCRGEEARQTELGLRRRIYYHEHLDDDTVIERTWVVSKAISDTGWGLHIQHTPSTEPRGAWGFAPVIREPADLLRLHFPEVIHDEAETARRLREAQDLLGDLLDVRLVGMNHISFHLMSLYCQLRGLGQVMLDMYDNPAMLHEAMAFLEEGHRRRIQQYIELNLLSLNNDGTYHSSGGVGYTDELPLPDYDPQRIRPCDMWSSAEAQEMAQVSPAQHAEFILPYEKRLLAPFALNGYGCCEDLTPKLDDVLTIPHLRRVSISPFADVARCAEKVGGACIYSWKPHPAHLVGTFDAAQIERYIRRTVDVARARGCILEMILKDTHTCENRPERFSAWTRIAREVIRDV